MSLIPCTDDPAPPPSSREDDGAGAGRGGAAELSIVRKLVHLFTGCSARTVADLNPQTRRASHGFQHGVGGALFSSPHTAEGGLFCPREFLKVGEQGTGTAMCNHGNHTPGPLGRSSQDLTVSRRVISLAGWRGQGALG